MPVADVAGGREAHPADQARGEVRENVAEHVLGDHHVIEPGLADQIERHRVDVAEARAEAGMLPRALREHGMEEGL